MIFSCAAVLVALLVAFAFLYLGFWMGRQVAERPIERKAKTYSPGAPVLDEYDAYEEALHLPGIDADTKEAGK
jgi:hypothetical protein